MGTVVLKGTICISSVYIFVFKNLPKHTFCFSGSEGSSSVMVVLSIRDIKDLILMGRNENCVACSTYSPKMCRCTLLMTHLITYKDAFLFQFPFHSLPNACNSQYNFKWDWIQQRISGGALCHWGAYIYVRYLSSLSLFPRDSPAVYLASRVSPAFLLLDFWDFLKPNRNHTEKTNTKRRSSQKSSYALLI